MSLFKKTPEEIYAENLKIRAENDKKILLLDKYLKTDKDIEEYIRLNRLMNLPKEKEWDKLLPKMIKELLAIGWNTEIKIHTKITYGLYRIELLTQDRDLYFKSHKIIDKYIERFELGR